MRVLAIDTALEGCSAAVLDTDRGGIVASETLQMIRGHAEAVMPLIARVMDQGAVEFAELDRIAVTTGPGSFTGLRVGISAARGIALAASKPAIGLSTLAGFAAPLYRGGRQHATWWRRSTPATTTSICRCSAPTGARWLRPASRRCVMRCARRMTGPARIVGSAADLVAAAWPKGAEPPLLVDQRGAPDIGWIARLGAAATDSYGPPKPLYLRAPDAQPQDAARLPRR